MTSRLQRRGSVYRAENSRAERLAARTKVARPINDAVEREAQPVWLAKRANGSEIKVCAVHLLADVSLSDAAPADEGTCAQCSELVLPTRHAVARWIERVGGRTNTEAAQQILAFVATAYTPTATPKWLWTPPSDGELLLNLRWSEVGLVKRRTSLRGFETAIIATVLTSAGPHP